MYALTDPQTLAAEIRWRYVDDHAGLSWRSTRPARRVTLDVRRDETRRGGFLPGLSIGRRILGSYGPIDPLDGRRRAN
ncbi:hypothetical protein KEM60_01322 [Austwickia sp. TVS 96-490-7B]|uniref:hypothetical protein n=1 Tax=Austwickia sp. TVS 96-490-7B TaxID=2830843 RepID=UPI001C55F928|nr:hypothetical protein [Austwickia sp. TVS 96-490-7B]MBW3085126.1 hypothetical protein [Austwickia sp. TVS 96-490-7B]